MKVECPLNGLIFTAQNLLKDQAEQKIEKKDQVS
jgi:hypothetical protein